MRHEFSYPNSLSHTKPHSELLGEFRSQYQQLMQQIEEESSDMESSSSSHSTTSSSLVCTYQCACTHTHILNIISLCKLSLCSYSGIAFNTISQYLVTMYKLT